MILNSCKEFAQLSNALKGYGKTQTAGDVCRSCKKRKKQIMVMPSSGSSSESWELSSADARMTRVETMVRERLTQ